ncbi:hypothetical protein OQA88_7940 [Cercophora sp. LCS_1]
MARLRLWSAREAHLNATIPQFTQGVVAPSETVCMHFAALFSKKEGAIPVMPPHGWPSSWLDYVGVLERVRARRDEETMPYHVVVSSLPDFGMGSGGVDAELGVRRAAEVLAGLMRGLVFGGGIGEKYVEDGHPIETILKQVSWC